MALEVLSPEFLESLSTQHFMLSTTQLCGISRQSGPSCLWCFSPYDGLYRQALPPIL